MGIHLELKGTGSYVPEMVVANDFFLGKDFFPYDKDGIPGLVSRFTRESLDDLSGGSPELRAAGVWGGIHTRRHPAPTDTIEYMARRAATAALEDAGIDAKSLAGILVATVSRRRDFPTTAQQVQRDLGVSNVCYASDYAYACAGFPAALNVANSLVRSEAVVSTAGAPNWLVIGVEDVVSMCHRGAMPDRNLFLFGAGAGAAVLSPTHDDSVGLFAPGYFGSDPFEKHDEALRRVDEYLVMPGGRSVLRAAENGMAGAFMFLDKRLEESQGFRFKFFVPHQANARILNGIKHKVCNNMHDKEGTLVWKASSAIVYRSGFVRLGNFSTGTCAVGLDELLHGCRVDGGPLVEGKLERGDTVVLAAVGGGYSIAGAAFRIGDVPLYRCMPSVV